MDISQHQEVCCGGSVKKVILALKIILMVVVILLVAVWTWNKIKEHDYIGRTNQQVYTIAIGGEGKVTAVPDIAQISLGVQTEKANVADAQKENTEKMNKIIEELKKLGVDKKDIQTQSYNIYPQYDWSTNRQILRGYQVSQNVSVKIRDLEKVGSVLEKSATLGANQVGSLSFTIDEPEKLRQEAREKALANAKEKAAALAKVAEVKLGKLVSFSESSISPTPYPLYKSMDMAVGMAESAPAPQIEAGSQDIVVDVNVVYEVL